MPAGPPPIAIVADSSACLPKELIDRHHMLVVPFQLVIDGRAYQDGLDITPTEFYRLQRLATKLPTTSTPSPQAFVEAFRRAHESGVSQVLAITISPRFSATLDAAKRGAELAKESLPGLAVGVMDSQAAAGAEGFVVLAAARAIVSESDLQVAMAAARAVSQQVRLYAQLETLAYLAKGGRVPRVAVWAASLLNIKPIAELVGANAGLVARMRSRSKATERLLELVVEQMHGKRAHLNVMHAACPEDARALAERLRASLICEELLVSEFTPVMGAHTGPGLLGVAFYAE